MKYYILKGMINFTSSDGETYMQRYCIKTINLLKMDFKIISTVNNSSIAVLKFSLTLKNCLLKKVKVLLFNWNFNSCTLQKISTSQNMILDQKLKYLSVYLK